MIRLNDRILFVDDNVDNLLILEELLGSEYSVMSATSGHEALAVAPVFRPDLILLDVMMPGLDGMETCRCLRALTELREARIVMLSARTAVHDRLAAYAVGAVDYIPKPFDHAEVMAKIAAWMDMVRKEKFDDVWREAEEARQVVGTAMLNLTSFRDTETGDHLFRVRWYAQLLAEQLAHERLCGYEIDDAFLENFFRATPLHDIGKVAIDDAILRKPGRLTEKEFKAMQRHTIVGDELLRTAARMLPSATYLQMAAQVARSHHEHFDGNGYPDRLVGAQIPLPARILCVADVFDALTSKRVYKRAMPSSEACHIIISESGKHFDPAVVAAFQSRVDDFEHAQKSLATDEPLYGVVTPGEPLLSTVGMDEWFLRTRSQTVCEAVV